MAEPSEEWPPRLEPYFVMSAPNEPITVLDGPFDILGREKGRLDSDLVFRWLPTPTLSFDGWCSLLHFPDDFDAHWHLVSSATRIPVALTHMALLSDGSQIRGNVQGMTALGDVPFGQLRFMLVNFPSYMGKGISYTAGDSQGATAGRLEVSDAAGTCTLDVIPEARDMATQAERDSGYVLTHVGQWTPAAGSMTPGEATDTISMLHAWFALLRGAQSGPLFSQGIQGGAVVFREIAYTRISESRKVDTWMPELSPLDLSALFDGFSRKWHDEVWRRPLTSALWWLREANAPDAPAQSRIILSQVALELLSWVHIVETKRLCSRSGFDGLSAADRIRYLLQSLAIPTDVPDYMEYAARQRTNDAYDGPGIVTFIRNALVHPTERKRARLDSLDGLTWWQCSQLAIQYVALVLLALCGYCGMHARRGHRGWRGEEEALVPWAETPAEGSA